MLPVCTRLILAPLPRSTSSPPHRQDPLAHTDRDAILAAIQRHQRQQQPSTALLPLSSSSSGQQRADAADSAAAAPLVVALGDVLDLRDRGSITSQHNGDTSAGDHTAPPPHTSGGGIVELAVVDCLPASVALVDAATTAIVVLRQWPAALDAAEAAALTSGGQREQRREEAGSAPSLTSAASSGSGVWFVCGGGYALLDTPSSSSSLPPFLSPLILAGSRRWRSVLEPLVVVTAASNDNKGGAAAPVPVVPALCLGVACSVALGRLQSQSDGSDDDGDDGAVMVLRCPDGALYADLLNAAHGLDGLVVVRQGAVAGGGGGGGGGGSSATTHTTPRRDAFFIPTTTVMNPSRSSGSGDIVPLLAALFAPLHPTAIGAAAGAGTVPASASATPTEASPLVGVRIAPLLPYRYRRYFGDEAALWQGLWQVLLTPPSQEEGGSQQAQQQEKAPRWLHEGQLLHVPCEQSMIDKATHSTNNGTDGGSRRPVDEAAVEAVAVRVRRLGPSFKALRDAPYAELPAPQRASHTVAFQVLSVVRPCDTSPAPSTNISSTASPNGSSSNALANVGGWFVPGRTRLEAADVSDWEGPLLVRAPTTRTPTHHHAARDTSSNELTRTAAALTSTRFAAQLLEALRRCEAYREAMHTADPSGATANSSGGNTGGGSGAVQAVLVTGDEANMAAATAEAVLHEAGMPYSLLDCRLGAAASNGTRAVSSSLGVVEAMADGCVITTTEKQQHASSTHQQQQQQIPVLVPMVLVVRHAQQLEASEEAQRAVGAALRTLRGPLSVVFVRERNSTSADEGASSNSGGGGNPKGAAGDGLRFAAVLGGALAATVHCGVPSEADRTAIAAALLQCTTPAVPMATTRSTHTARGDPSRRWAPSLTLRPALVAAWTVGMTTMDIVTLLHSAAAAAQREPAVRALLQADPSANAVLCDEQLQAALRRYQRDHGLVLTSTKLQPVRWADVGGLAEAKRELLETIQLPTKFPHLFKAGGMRRKMGVLLFGPPGCGKTLLAKAIATEMNMNFLSVKGPELINQYVGESERNVRDIFQRARDNSPCVLFFDELDALAPARGAKGDAGGAMDRIASQLLLEMDGCGNSSGGDVFIVAATNRPDMLDAAMLRPGRFDQRCYLGPPATEAEKLEALQALTRKFTLGPDVDLAAVAAGLQHSGERYTGADLFALCSDAMMAAVEERVAELKQQLLKAPAASAPTAAAATFEREEGPTKCPKAPLCVAGRHFAKALSQLKPSVSAEEFAKYEQLRTNINPDH